ncbi:hypothetical protein ABPG75_001980 [Micractinium tetrahymenae]
MASVRTVCAGGAPAQHDDQAVAGTATRPPAAGSGWTAPVALSPPHTSPRAAGAGRGDEGATGGLVEGAPPMATASAEAAQPSPAAPASTTPPPGRPAVLEAPLTRLGVGMWASRRHRECQLLLMPGEQQLVVLCDRRAAQPPRSPSRFALAVGPLAAKSPFASGHSAYRAAGCVHAFELPFASIRGIDYQNPLCHDGRLVLEVAGLRKREFPTMDAAREYFVEPAAVASPDVAAQYSASRGSAAGSGLLQAALQAQSEPQAAPPMASAPDAADRRASDSELAASGGMNGTATSSARDNLLWRLESSSGSGARPQQEPSLPVPIGGAGRLSLPFKELPSSARSSFDSYESDPGSPASGSLWYWGSPASLAGGSSSRLSSAALRGTGSRLRSARGSSDGHDSWEDGSAGGSAPAGMPASAPGRSRLSFQHQQQEQQQATQQQQLSQQATQQQQLSQQATQQHQRAAEMHVGSAPTPSLLSSPPSRSPLAWAEAGPPGGGGGLHRVASDGQLLARAGEGGRQQQAQGADGPPEQGWPAAHAFTVVSRVYKYRTVVLHWTDPRLPGMLRPIIQGNERLLRLHESGLPAWAVYAPQYGLYYRPWLRTVTWLLFYAFSAFSFAVGFYDLYKSIPGLQLVMQRLMASMWLPPAAVLEWLEQHTQIRLSILLTYLFGKSEALVWFMRWAQHFARLARAAVQPVTDVLGPPATALGQALSAVGLTLVAVLQAALGPIAALLLQLWAVLGGALLPVALLLRSVVAGPFLLLASGLRQLGAASGAVWAAVSDSAGGLAAGAAALGGTARAGRAVGGATSHALADQALWLYIIPADALEVLRTSAIKAVKATQAVAKFFLQMCDNVVRHRLTLGLRAGRAWRRVRAWLEAAARAPRRLLAALLGWLLAALRLLILDRLQAAPGPAAPHQERAAHGSPQLQHALPQQLPSHPQQQQQQQQQAVQGAGEACAASLRLRPAAAASSAEHAASAGSIAAPEAAPADNRLKAD